MVAIKRELSECEKQLKQEQHEKDILKLENEALRQKILLFRGKSGDVGSNGLDINDLSIEKGYDHSHYELSYQLLSPRSESQSLHNSMTPTSSSPATPIAINWSNSSNSNLTPRYLNDYKSPSAYSRNTNHTNLSHYPSTTVMSPSSDTNIANIEETKDEETSTIEIPDFEQEQLNENEYPLEVEMDDDCGSVENCMAIKRIVDALKWYALSGDDHESVYKKMKTDNYGKRIVNDYNHIMTEHLDNDLGTKNDADLRNEYDLICTEVSKYVKPCTFVQCAGYRRYAFFVYIIFNGLLYNK